MTFLLTQIALLGPLLVGLGTHPPDALQDTIDAFTGDEIVSRELPKKQFAKLGDVLKLTVEADMIRISVIPKIAGSSVRVEAPNVRGAVELSIFTSDDGTKHFNSFMFRRHDRHDPMWGEMIINISAVGPQTLISRDFESARFNGSIQFVQDPPPADPVINDEDPVRLTVRRTDDTHATKELDIKLSAKTFTQLCREHPDVVNEFLRPILHEFDQDGALFAVPPAVAWQVLGDAKGADPTLRGKIDRLLKAVDVEDYQQRQAAIDGLKALGAESMPVLRQMDRGSMSVQQSAVVDSLLAESSTIKAEGAKPAEDDPSFLLDVLYNDDPRLKALAIDRLSRLTGQKLTIADARDAAAVNHLRDRLLPTTQPTR